MRLQPFNLNQLQKIVETIELVTRKNGGQKAILWMKQYIGHLIEHFIIAIIAEEILRHVHSMF